MEIKFVTRLHYSGHRPINVLHMIEHRPYHWHILEMLFFCNKYKKHIITAPYEPVNGDLHL